MATKKHKKRRHDTRSEEQRAQSARDIAQQETVAKEQDKKASSILSRSKDKSKSTKAVAKKDAKPTLFNRFITYCKEVKGEMQRVVWPTRPELINASLIVIAALVFFGVSIAIIDNIIIIPLDAISTLGVTVDG